ncbi:MAG: hypothetical protein OXP75_08280 [Rhodospirillales bacterium]|nr:hypothetical protein [Rhodospirillales bacterium]
MRNQSVRWPAGLFAASLVALVLAACSGATHEPPPPPAGEARTLEHQGVERHYYLQNAEAAAAAPASLVVSLHGYRGLEQALAERSDLSQLSWGPLVRVARREGFVVAYPHAWLGKWSQFEGLENTTLEDGRTVDDVGFIARMIERLVDEGLVDPARVYLTGFSDGAIMSYKLLCAAGAPFAAAAPAGGSMYQRHRDNCAATVPIPLLVIAGTNDRSLPYDGWIFPTGRELSIPETMEHFRLLHGCTGQKSDLLYDRYGEDQSRVLEVVWTGCATPNAVKLLRVEGGGHNAPSFEPIPEAWREWAGTHNRDIESAEEIWAFLRQFERRPSDSRPTAREEPIEYAYEVLGPFDADKVPFISHGLRESVRRDFVGNRRSTFTLAVCQSGCAAWSWGQRWTTTREHIRNVLQQCEHNGREPCGLVAVNGELVKFEVQPTQITYPHEFVSSAVPFVSSASLRRIRSGYAAGAQHRALALNHTGRYGYATGQRSEEQARRTALARCREYSGVWGHCFLYDVNGTVVFNPAIYLYGTQSWE